MYHDSGEVEMPVCLSTLDSQQNKIPLHKNFNKLKLQVAGTVSIIVGYKSHIFHENNLDSFLPKKKD